MFFLSSALNNGKCQILRSSCLNRLYGDQIQHVSGLSVIFMLNLKMHKVQDSIAAKLLPNVANSHPGCCNPWLVYYMSAAGSSPVSFMFLNLQAFFLNATLNRSNYELVLYSFKGSTRECAAYT